MRPPLIARFALACVLALACVACAPAPVRESGPRIADLADAVPYASFRAALPGEPVLDARLADATRDAAVAAVAMDLGYADGTMTVAVFPDRSSAYAGDTWTQACICAGLPALEANAGDVLRDARRHPDRFDQPCDRAPPVGMARLWMRTADGVRCLPSVRIDSIVPRGKFDLYCVMASVVGLPVAEPEI